MLSFLPQIPTKKGFRYELYMVWKLIYRSLRLWKPFFSNLICWRIIIQQTGTIFPFYSICSIWRRNLMKWDAVVFASNSDKKQGFRYKLYMVWKRIHRSLRLWKPFFSNLICWRIKIRQTGPFSRFFRLFVLTSKLVKLVYCPFALDSDKNKYLDNNFTWYES